LGFILVTNLIWESAQLPLYTLWSTGTPLEIAWAVVYCTAGDVLIAAGALVIGWLVAGLPSLAHAVPARLVLTTILAGMAFTALSEWRSTQVTHAWTYAAAMPLVLATPIGLAPILQWLFLPALALWKSFGWRGR
jgi:hypothetical protein